MAVYSLYQLHRPCSCIAWDGSGNSRSCLEGADRATGTNHAIRGRSRGRVGLAVVDGDIERRRDVAERAQETGYLAAMVRAMVHGMQNELP